MSAAPLQQTLFANQKLAMAAIRQMLRRAIAAIDAGHVADVCDVGIICAMLEDCTLSLASDRDEAGLEFLLGSAGDYSVDDEFLEFMGAHCQPGESRHTWSIKVEPAPWDPKFGSNQNEPQVHPIDPVDPLGW